ncbi:MAG: hypothetical protein P8Y70_00080 [Candidatus Lokiarchaeota archaeon]
MSLYFNDKIYIIIVTRDDTYKTESLADPILSFANVEMLDKVSRGSDGDAVIQKTKIQVPGDTNIKKGDYVRICEMQGITISEDTEYGKLRKVTRADPIGVYRIDHIQLEFISGN